MSESFKNIFNNIRNDVNLYLTYVVLNKYIMQTQKHIFKEYRKFSK